MTSPGLWSPVLRGNGPEFLAVWLGHPSGYWRLSVYRRDWHEEDSTYTDTPVKEPRPGDGWLEKLGFVPAGEEEWAEVEGGGWQRAVALAVGD